MRLSPCECDPAQLVRVGRARWMRLIPGSGLYQCRACGATMLLQRSRVDDHRIRAAQRVAPRVAARVPPRGSHPT